jgi:hypothetical protein
MVTKYKIKSNFTYFKLLQNLGCYRKYFSREQGLSYSSFLFYSFQVGIWVPIVFKISDTCPFFLNSFSSFFTNNFCIVSCLFSAIKTWSTYLVDGKTYQACFCAYPQYRSSAYMGGVYVILILRAWQTSYKGQQSLTKLNAKASNIYVEVFLT